MLLFELLHKTIDIVLDDPLINLVQTHSIIIIRQVYILRIPENVGERARAVHLISRACIKRRLAFSGKIIDSNRGRRRRRRSRRHLFVVVCVRELLYASRFAFIFSPRQRSTNCQNQDVVTAAVIGLIP